MKKIIKIFVALCLGTLMAFGIAGCNTAPQESNEMPPVESVEPPVEDVELSDGQKRDNEILKYHREPTIDENFEDNIVKIILKNGYSGDIGFDEFKSVDNISEISSIKYRLETIYRGSEDKFAITEKSSILTLELADHDKEKVLRVIELLKKYDMVLVAEPAYIYEIVDAWVPDDAYYQEQWGLCGTYGIGAGNVWNITTGSYDVKVGLFENGADYTHEDLAGHIFSGNYTGSSTNGHGTHVAGIIGATHNSYGIAGVSECSMYMLNRSITSFEDSLVYASENGIKIINASFYFIDIYGDYAQYSSSQYTAIAEYDGLLVCAAGNDGLDTDSKPMYPACYDLPNVISVGSIDTDGERSYFSNYGEKSVDIYALGRDILSTFPQDLCTGETVKTNWGDYLSCECEWGLYSGSFQWIPNGTTHYANGYHYMSGTSMAAPHVTGVAALMLSENPDLTPAELKAGILDNAVKDSGLTSYCVTGGRLNAYWPVHNSLPNHRTLIRYKINTRKPFTTGINDEYVVWGEDNYLSDGSTYGVEGYDFVGWSLTAGTFVDGVGTVGAEVAYTGSQKVVHFLPMTSSVNLYAVWKVKSWTVIEYRNNELIGEHEMVYDGPSITFSAQSIDGYNFVEWRKQYNNTSNYTFVSSESTITLNPNENMPPQGWSFYFLAAIYEQACVAEGSMITLADGRQVAVEELTGDESLLVWNLYTGCFDTAPILFTDVHNTAVYNVVKLTFSDGTVVKIINEHALWDTDLNKYVYLREDAAKYLGHKFRKAVEEDGTFIYKEVELVGVDIVQEYTTAYSPVTYGHLCYFVDGMLSVPGGIEGLFNVFEVDPVQFRYDEEKMQLDIEQYGLYTYEEFYELVPVTEEAFGAFSGQYLKVAIGKGLVTLERLYDLAVKYDMLAI